MKNKPNLQEIICAYGLSVVIIKLEATQQASDIVNFFYFHHITKNTCLEIIQQVTLKYTNIFASKTIELGALYGI